MKTKNLCGILMLFSFLVSCTEQQCIIHGTTTGVKDGDYMYITEYLDNTYLDSAVVMNGKFTFKLPKASEEDFLPKVIVPAVGNEPSVACVFTQDSEVKYIRDSQKRLSQNETAFFVFAKKIGQVLTSLSQNLPVSLIFCISSNPQLSSSASFLRLNVLSSLN